jgi:large subunit ribosomal protein L31
MKAGIHPSYKQSTVTCACGSVVVTRSTRGSFTTDVCSNCHPFYTGRQKLMDTGGRVERFQRRVAKGRAHSAQTRSA